MPSADTASPDARLNWQNVPSEILTLILKPLVSRPRESYIPLICTHVCGHWRRVVSSTPLLWSFIDVSRGDMLTQLWLANSAQVKIDVRLWEHPSVSYGLSRLHPPTPKHPLALSLIHQTVERWRSLDIAYACLCRTVDAIKSLQPHSAPQLDYLTIGPMGKTAMHTDMRLSDPDLLKAMLLADTTFQPLVVRIDSFTVCPTSPIFSARLLELEVFSDAPLAMDMWYPILASAPNLTSLKLWHAGSTDSYINRLDPDTPALRFEHLKYLSLSGVFVALTTLISKSSTPISPPSLPALTSLRLSSTTPKVVPLYIGYLSAVAPLLSDLSVSFPRQRRRVESWKKALPNLRSLDRLTFFEMDVVIVFCLLKAELHDLPKPLSYLGLERMSVPSDSDWSFLEANGHRTKVIIKDLPGSECVQSEKWEGKEGVEYELDSAIIRATESVGSDSDSGSGELETDTDEEDDEYGSHTPSESSEDQEDEQEEQGVSEPGGEERVPKKKHDSGGDDDDDSWSLASGDLEVINQPLESEAETDSDSAFTSDSDD